MRLSRQGTSWLVRAPAKVNLFLKVLGRRPDGFHELETLMVSVGLYDTLRFSHAEPGQIRLQCRSRIGPAGAIPTDERNLIQRAASLLKQETGCREGASIDLIKRIPVEAGMGGGSSDAAASLVALNRLWKLGLTSSQLHPLAAKLGSDVNFFLDGHAAAACLGRGEQIEPVPLRRRWDFVIVKPPTGLSTGEVFRKWGEHGSRCQTSLNDVVRAAARADSRSLPRVLENDLTAPARALNPDVDQWLSRLGRLDLLGSGMTGSGSACFAICRNDRHARKVAEQCRSWGAGEIYLAPSRTDRSPLRI